MKIGDVKVGAVVGWAPNAWGTRHGRSEVLAVGLPYKTRGGSRRKDMKDGVQVRLLEDYTPTYGVQYTAGHELIVRARELVAWEAAAARREEQDARRKQEQENEAKAQRLIAALESHEVRGATSQSSIHGPRVMITNGTVEALTDLLENYV